jgi:hypothetical protein
VTTLPTPKDMSLKSLRKNLKITHVMGELLEIIGKQLRLQVAN